MCGIIGCILKNSKAAPVIHDALKRLEYRGYDSVGEATISRNRLFIKKDEGKIDEVHKAHNLDDLPGRIGIGHTRWATHGAPSTVNAHPHIDCSGQIAVVHNGIIENFFELKKELKNHGHTFRSETDTEVIPHLIEEGLRNGSNLERAVWEAVKRLKGSYALAVIYAKKLNKIVCARRESPLVLGVAEDAVYFASDIPAFLPLTNKVVVVKDGELVILSDTGYEIRRIPDYSRVSRKNTTIRWNAEMVKKGGYPHFMLKEIHEQPTSISNALRIQEQSLDLMTRLLERAGKIFLVAAGTSYHACLAASYIFSRLAHLTAYPTISSEFIEQHKGSIDRESILLAVSQSGETADTLAAARYAKERGATVLGVTNVMQSTLTRIVDAHVCQQSGPEIGVAATKTFTSQLSVLIQLAIRLADRRGKISRERVERLRAKFESISKIVENIIKTQTQKIKQIAKKYKNSRYFFFLGRGVSTAIALEGKLKLLEIAYVPSIAYPAGESKHGPISLIEPGSPVVFICPRDETRKNTIGNIMEMKARGASIITIVEKGDEEVKSLSDDFVEIPRGIPDILKPILGVIPLQLFAYYMAVERGCDPDKPRNLAKSVTVK